MHNTTLAMAGLRQSASRHDIRIDDVVKRYGDVVAVDRVSAHFVAGSFTTLLGPSGCGKTSLLRLLAGFETPDSGIIRFGTDVVAEPGHSRPPEQRSIGVVFQSYALWPHMRVGENVGYPLKVRRTPSAEHERRVSAMLELVGLTGLEDRRIEELSGGQRQRVALARCLVADARTILFDEPLANLDVHLRAQMVDVFRDIHRRTGVTIVYVTHDQAEALALSDTICVMEKGRIVQSGAPQDIYGSPASRYVAGFVGRGVLVSAALEARSDGQSIASIAGFRFPVRGNLGGATGDVLLRPESLAVGALGIPVEVETATYRGAAFEIRGWISGTTEAIIFDHAEALSAGEIVHLTVTDAWILPGT